MSVFIGSDTAQIEYDFGLKVANSVAECPMKIYKQEVDPAALPTPTTTYTNLITNGDFGNGTTGWSVFNATGFSVTSNIASFTATVQYGYIKTNANISLIAGHKYYSSANAKSTVSCDVGFALWDGAWVSSPNITIGTSMTKLSSIGVATNTVSTGTIQINDRRTSGWTIINCEKVMVVDLTAIFGAGNEPTQAWCDTYLPFVLTTGTCPTGWTEITSQTVLDKLKSQNELPVTAIATDKSTVTWNGKTLPKTTTLKVLDDFVGKIANSTVENPHRIYDSICTTLQNPSNYTNNNLTGFNDWFNRTQVQLDKLSTLNGVTTSYGTTSIGQTPQQLFSFNIIEMFERKFGSIPKETTAEKVAWLKSNLSNMSFKWYGFGISPLGNKATVQTWVDTSSAWGNNTKSNTSTSSTLLELVLSDSYPISNRLTPDGFVHFLAYTDSARTTDSTLLVLTGHGLSAYGIIENTTRGVVIVVPTVTPNTIVTTAITGQVSGDTIKKYNYSATKNAETGTDTTTLKITNHGLNTGDFIKNKSRSDVISKVTVVDVNTLTLTTAITGQVSGDIIYLYPLLGTQTAEATVIPSTIYTDYVSLELTLKAPENLITATNTLSDIVTDYTGKVVNSTTENANISKTSLYSTLQNPSTNFSEVGSTTYGNINTLNSVCGNASTPTNGIIPQHLFSFNIVSAVEKALGQPIPAVDKVQWCKDFINSIKIDWTGYGSCPSGNKAYLKAWNLNNDSLWSTGIYNTNNVPSLLSGLYNVILQIGNMIQNDGMVHFLASTDPSDGNTASTIFTDYVKLTIKLKYIPTYDFYTDSNTRRDAGLTDIVLVKRTIGDMVSDFTGKVANSTTENPNIQKYTNIATGLQTPNLFTGEIGTDSYSQIYTLNGICSPTSRIGVNQIAQQLFQFNLIEIAQRALGTSIPGADTAGKVQWLKDNLAIVKCDWYGYGSCPSGNKAKLTTYNVSTLAWSTITTDNDASTPTLSTKYISSSFENYIDSDGFVNFLAYTDATDGVTPSVINTDYIKLTLTFKSDTVGYEYFTNNSAEVSVTTSNKASAYLIECDLTPIATALYGGSNSALKSALKSISADVYAMGSGANVNSLGNSVGVKIWMAGGSAYTTSTPLNKTSSITKVSFPLVQADTQYGLTTTNKYYIIVYSTYKSDGAISSEVNLDYVNIKVNLTRIPDVISNPPTIELTDTFSLLVRGFSPSWDNTQTVDSKHLLHILSANLNGYKLYYNVTNDSFGFKKYYNSGANTISLLSNPQTFNKYQIFSFLIEQNLTGMKLKILKNNGTFETYVNTDTNLFSGSFNLYPLMKSDGFQADAFLDSIVYMPNMVFDDTQSEAILRGTKEGFEFSQILDQSLSTTQTVNVLPNNQYQLKTTISTVITEMYNNIVIKTTTVTADTTFTTQSKTNKIKLDITGSFGLLSFKIKM